MSEQYYFLVAGLPDIALDATKPGATTLSLLAEIESQLSSADKPLLEVFRAPFDNANLINLVENRGRPFDPRSSMTQEELEAVLRTRGGPSYMEEWLTARKDGKVLFPGLSAEDTLAALFFEEASLHPNVFVSAWFSFERDLRNILSGLQVRRAKEAPAMEKILVGKTEVTDAILKSTSADISVGALFPWTDRIASIARTELVKREKAVDQLRWEILDELSALSHFGAETLLAFFVKFCIAERWMALEPAEGRQMLERLTEALTAGLTVKETA